MSMGRSDRPLDSVDGKPVGHVLGHVGHVVDDLDEVAKLSLAA